MDILSDVTPNLEDMSPVYIPPKEIISATENFGSCTRTIILSGSLSKNSVLFWDEPETNLNPKMIKPVVDAVIELAKTGVQVFVTTHDYFAQQCFNMAALYLNNPNTKGIGLQYRFMSLYQTENGVVCESADTLSELTHNAVMEEFDQLYDREQELLYGV